MAAILGPAPSQVNAPPAQGQSRHPEPQCLHRGDEAVAAARRIYLSVRVFATFGKVLKYVVHELGHFETNSLFERNAELKASSIRRKARRACR